VFDAKAGINRLESACAIRFTDPLSLSGHHYPVAVLAKQDLRAESFFGRVLYTYSHPGSIRAVLDGIVDAAAVDSLVYAGELRRQPDLARQLRVIHRSPPLGISPVVVPRSAHPKLVNALRAALLAWTHRRQAHPFASRCLALSGPPPDSSTTRIRCSRTPSLDDKEEDERPMVKLRTRVGFTSSGW
jgi:ABC-type phosphate/phosphonate transport system substrate-binding protein